MNSVLHIFHSSNASDRYVRRQVRKLFPGVGYVLVSIPQGDCRASEWTWDWFAEHSHELDDVLVMGNLPHFMGLAVGCGIGRRVSWMDLPVDGIVYDYRSRLSGEIMYGARRHIDGSVEEFTKRDRRRSASVTGWGREALPERLVEAERVATLVRTGGGEVFLID